MLSARLRPARCRGNLRARPRNIGFGDGFAASAHLDGVSVLSPPGCFGTFIGAED
jgi:hypothetical protein